MNVETRDSGSHRVELLRVGRYGDLLITFFQADGSPMARIRVKKNSFMEFINKEYPEAKI